MKTRIYEVCDNETGTSRLVDAISSSAAVRHIAEPLFSVSVAAARRVADLMADGAKVEVAAKLVIAGEAA